MEQLENNNEEMQDFKTYFSPVNAILSPFMNFDEKGNLTRFTEANLSLNHKKELMSYFWRMELTKNFKIKRYAEIIAEIADLNKSIEKELQNFD